MIESFKHKGLAELSEKGRSKHVGADLRNRAIRRLDALKAAKVETDMNIPGFDFHELEGDRKGTYSVHINGPWCITFKWSGTNATDVDLEQYH